MTALTTSSSINDYAYVASIMHREKHAFVITSGACPSVSFIVDESNVVTSGKPICTFDVNALPRTGMVESENDEAAYLREMEEIVALMPTREEAWDLARRSPPPQSWFDEGEETGR
jgi:hypothetical protein